MVLTLDTSTDFGKRAQHLLETGYIVWLTTVDADGRPYPSPVWFHYDDDGTVLIYSQRNKPKLRNIAQNGAVALNFDSEARGDKVVIFEAGAVIDESTRPAHEHAAYIAKYHDGIVALGMTDESFSQEFCIPIRVVLQKVRGW